MFKTIAKKSEIEIIEKKSRFIGVAYPIASPNEAILLIQEIKNKHPKANHNCSAYTVGEMHKYDDDGEPGGMAGLPIFSVLQKENIHNTLVVVTRYFGGILLGGGGLVRAYSKAAREAVMAAEVVTMVQFVRYQLSLSYELLGKVQYYLAKNNITTENTVYQEKIELTTVVLESNRKLFENSIKEIDYTIEIKELEIIYGRDVLVR